MKERTACAWTCVYTCTAIGMCRRSPIHMSMHMWTHMSIRMAVLVSVHMSMHVCIRARPATRTHYFFIRVDGRRGRHRSTHVFTRAYTHVHAHRSTRVRCGCLTARRSTIHTSMPRVRGACRVHMSARTGRARIRTHGCARVRTGAAGDANSS